MVLNTFLLFLAIIGVKMSKISVIIPAHNEEGYIGSTIQAIRSQTYTNYEIIVVCDSCQDMTEQIVREQGAKTLSVNRHNVGAARNAGSKLSNGDILVFNDSDTIMSPNYLEEVKNAISRSYNFGCTRLKPETQHPIGILTTLILNYFSIVRRYFHGNFFIDKGLFERVGGYNERLNAGEDTDLAERLKEMGRFKFLWNTYLVSSERDFRDHGYFREFLRRGKEGIQYLITRSSYYEKHQIE